jgi:hypothetical protein
LEIQDKSKWEKLKLQSSLLIDRDELDHSVRLSVNGEVDQELPNMASPTSYFPLASAILIDAEKDEVDDEDVLTIDQSVKITFHCMPQFDEIMKLSGVARKDLYDSLSPEFNRKMAFKAGKGAGASGSFFFFSHDGKFIIKTMSNGEVDLLCKKLLPGYLDHLLNNPMSLLARIFGVFTIKMQSFADIHVMLMENTLRLQKKGANLKHVFDLKGSKVNRDVKPPLKPSTVLKDINLLDIKREN